MMHRMVKLCGTVKSKERQPLSVENQTFIFCSSCFAVINYVTLHQVIQVPHSQ